MRFLAVILLFLALPVRADAGTIRGTVTDQSTGGSLPYVNVILQGTLRGVSTGVDGRFELSGVTAGTHQLQFSLLGYQRRVVSVTVPSEGELSPLIITLQPDPIQAEQIIVTASKREQSLEEAPVSVSVLDATAIRYRNSLTIDDALRYVPGVYFSEFQVNIRGSSGYNRGVGSRVLMLVDGVPFLTGDTGEINFETIPVGQVERIEVVKGASSALYGSSALGGVINVITKPVAEQPLTTVRAYGGFYSEPSYDAWRWNEGTRFLDGESVTHSQTIGAVGFTFFGSRMADDGFRRNDYRRRYNALAKVRYTPTSASSLTTTFNILHQRRGSFLYWKDVGHALVPPDNQLSDKIESTRYNISGQYRAVLSDQMLLTANALWFANDFTGIVQGDTQGSRSDVVRGEIQGTWSPGTQNTLTFGAEANTDHVRSDLFGNRSGRGFGIYVQDDLQLSGTVQLTGGLRFDSQDVDSLESESELNPKAGLVFTPMEGTTLRASFGRGFRIPSVAEAFTSTNVSGVPVVPNPAVRPERSTSYEIGARQRIGDDAVVDLALFRNDFDNLIEAGFSQTPAGNTVIRFDNVTKARIQGLEISTQVGLLDNLWVLHAGYTYLDPRDLTKNDVLRYRPRHLLYAGSQLTWNMFLLGADFRYISRYERIDQEFVDLNIVRNGDERVPIYVVDLRLGMSLEHAGIPLRLSFNVNNLLQYYYVEIIGNIAPIRSYVLVAELHL
jgi:outer membrane receptor for ferrienterochelin and colicins